MVRSLFFFIFFNVCTYTVIIEDARRIPASHNNISWCALDYIMRSDNMDIWSNMFTEIWNNAGACDFFWIGAYTEYLFAIFKMCTGGDNDMRNFTIDPSRPITRYIALWIAHLVQSTLVQHLLTDSLPRRVCSLFFFFFFFSHCDNRCEPNSYHTCNSLPSLQSDISHR